MAKLGRPFVYQSEDEKPVTVSLRIPRDLYDRMSRYAARHRQSITELLLDGLTWRLEQDDPRRESMGDISNYDNTVLQEKGSARRTGRPSTMREPILNLLREHPEGLSAEQIRGFLSP